MAVINRGRRLRSFFCGLVLNCQDEIIKIKIIMHACLRRAERLYNILRQLLRVYCSFMNALCGITTVLFHVILLKRRPGAAFLQNLGNGSPDSHSCAPK
jgi:hypothetical protein